MPANARFGKTISPVLTSVKFLFMGSCALVKALFGR